MGPCVRVRWQVASYVAKLDLPCPVHENPADFILFLASKRVWPPMQPSLDQIEATLSGRKCRRDCRVITEP
jgi:hypothetical protein